MKYAEPLVRTSVSLDRGTLDAMADLAAKMDISKSEVMRRAIQKLKCQNEMDARRPTPVEALERLQNSEGITTAEAEAWKAEVVAERLAKSYWWENR